MRIRRMSRGVYTDPASGCFVILLEQIEERIDIDIPIEERIDIDIS